MRPWLWIPSSWSHSLAPYFLKVSSLFQSQDIPKWRPFQWRGLNFPNRIGLAAGLDKDGNQIPYWWKFGVGFLEAGTIVPLPQAANPGRIMNRNTKARAVWNKMGFPSAGLGLFQKRLQRLQRPYPSPVFVNIGKNRQTSNQEALRDYEQCLRAVAGKADGIVVNISSPNTVGLRELSQKENLEPLLRGLKMAAGGLPVLLKLSPDMEESDFRRTVGIAAAYVDGFVLTNTTSDRSQDLGFPSDGGVSGQPLQPRSKQALKACVAELGARRPEYLVISVGGILSAQDVQERLDLGADLVEVYSALIFDGPWFFRKALRQLSGR